MEKLIAVALLFAIVVLAKHFLGVDFEELGKGTLREIRLLFTGSWSPMRLNAWVMAILLAALALLFTGLDIEFIHALSIFMILTIAGMICIVNTTNQKP